MKILHYSLGLPPFRTGGLTKYCTDLMLNQLKMGQDVSLLFPGKITDFFSTSIKDKNRFFDVKIFELINPLPISLLWGIEDIKSYTKATSKLVYHDFLKKIMPDVIHVHTLMGIHKEFFESAKELGIKIIYTTHDYFGICPKVNLLDYNEVICEDYMDGRKCLICNKGALSLNLIKTMQSPFYRIIKENTIIKYLRRLKKRTVLSCKENNSNILENDEISNEYIKLRKFYMKIFRMLDFIHFNSTISEEIFSKYINTKGNVISISHSNIGDNRKEKKIGKRINFGFIGSAEKCKGLPFLLDVVSKVVDNDLGEFCLNIYGIEGYDLCEKLSKYVKIGGRFNYSELNKVFDKIDILIVPSLWKETFGFIALEALSFGVPVIISENVGAKDIIKDCQGVIFNTKDNSLQEVLQNIIKNPKMIEQFNENILKAEFNYTFDKHTNDILEIYKKIIQNN